MPNFPQFCNKSCELSIIFLKFSMRYAINQRIFLSLQLHPYLFLRDMDAESVEYDDNASLQYW